VLPLCSIPLVLFLRGSCFIYAFFCLTVYRLQIPQTSHRHFSSLARRLGRIFAHAYFHHREVFEQAEAESSLYARFLALTSKFDLVPAEFLVIPPRIIQTDNDGRDINVDPPRLMAAAVLPHIPANEEATPSDSTIPPGLGTESPRKVGRNRTDTMVFSDGFLAPDEVSRLEDEDAELPAMVIIPESTQLPDDVQALQGPREAAESSEESSEQAPSRLSPEPVQDQDAGEIQEETLATEARTDNIGTEEVEHDNIDTEEVEHDNIGTEEVEHETLSKDTTPEG
jgi:hypothetical protein